MYKLEWEACGASACLLRSCPCRDLLLLLCLGFCDQSKEGATGQECPQDPAEAAGPSSTSCEQVVVSADTPARESTVLSNSPCGAGSHSLTEREETAGASDVCGLSNVSLGGTVAQPPIMCSHSHCPSPEHVTVGLKTLEVPLNAAATQATL